jgi:ketosteroid isomerase-like protein
VPVERRHDKGDIVIYASIVERKLRAAFAALNRGDHAPILASFGEHVEHAFFGRHALGGSRSSMARIEPWYRRLKRIFPDLRFEIDALVVRGAPWNTVALVEWRDHFTLPDGSRRGNQGVHALRLRWGKVVSLRVYCDTQLLERVLADIESQGVAEAGMTPISDA